jgi:hypothetical protein
MKDYGKVKSTVRPNALVVDEFSAWVNTNITEVSENVGQQNEFIGFEFNQVQYEKDEYIKMLSDDKIELTGVVDDLIQVLIVKGVIF